MDRLLLTYPQQLRGTSLQLAEGERPPKLGEEWKITRASRDLGYGQEAFRAASDALWTWQVHANAGVRPRLGNGEAPLGWWEGQQVRLRIGPIRSACEIVHAERAAEGAQGWRTAVAYGTLQGHVEKGEECFIVETVPGITNARSDALVRGTCVAFSQPAWRVARLAKPLASFGQDMITQRYLAAMARAAGRGVASP